MQAEQQSELLPCPFCGGEATRSKTMDESLWSHETVPYHKVYCPECEIGTEYRCEGWDPTAEEAWNTRAALSHPSPQGWPCEVVEADFSVNTVTLQMKDADYLVSVGEYRLIPPPEQGSKG